MLKLRYVDQQSIRLSQMAALWQRLGWQVGIGLPPRTGHWVSITDEQQRWQGWLQPRIWLEHTAPALAKLADGAYQEQDALSLLTDSERPLDWSIETLSYQCLHLGPVIEGDQLPAQSMLWLATPQGTVWLSQVPFDPEPFQQPLPIIEQLPINLNFVLGHSRISLTLLKQITCGDLLLIQYQQSVVTSQGIAIASYKHHQEEIIMQWDEETIYQHDEQPIEDLEDQIITSDFNTLPVRLEFVLHNHLVTLAELRNLCQDELIPLPIEAEQHVEIRANGMVLGQGELVQLEGKLGIEINQWRGGVKNVE